MEQNNWDQGRGWEPLLLMKSGFLDGGSLFLLPANADRSSHRTCSGPEGLPQGCVFLLPWGFQWRQMLPTWQRRRRIFPLFLWFSDSSSWTTTRPQTARVCSQPSHPTSKQMVTSPPHPACPPSHNQRAHHLSLPGAESHRGRARGCPWGRHLWSCCLKPYSSKPLRDHCSQLDKPVGKVSLKQNQGLRDILSLLLVDMCYGLKSRMAPRSLWLESPRSSAGGLERLCNL